MIIFLDIDGVLNRHQKASNGYCGIKQDCVRPFNAILQSVPEAKIVISSAWRYMISRGAMTLKGFEYLLLVHGIDCKDRVIGHTDEDPGPFPKYQHDPGWMALGLQYRAEQIEKWVRENGVTSFVVLDDLPLEVANLVKVRGDIGLEWHQATDAVLILTEKDDA